MNLKIFDVLSVFLLLGGLLTFHYIPSSLQSNTQATSVEPCQEPLTYRIGDIDPRFDISSEEVIAIMDQVESLWATALDRPLLSYRQDGKVAIHLVYSDDQKRTEQEQAFSERLQTKEDRIATMRREYQRLKDNFDKQQQEYQQTLSTFNNRATAFNQLVKKWEGRKTPSKVVNRIKQMRNDISQMKAEVDRKRENLELIRNKTNATSRKLNRLVDQQNEMVATYNSRFSTTKKFNQGRYIRQGNHERINIFQFANKAQLKTVLAHESGHALGLNHVSNPESVMYRLMQQQNIFNLSLTDEDIEAIRTRCNQQAP